MQRSIFPQSVELKRYVEGGLRQVDGWLGGDAVWVIAELSRQQIQAGGRGPVAEIGVHHGQLLILLALTQTDNKPVVAIDLFEDQDQNLDASGSGDASVFQTNAEAAGVDFGNVRLLRANSLDLKKRDILDKTDGEQIRLFSVDGGHSAQLTHNDLQLASQTLSEQGIVILDDAFSPMWPGVMTGLMEFLRSGRRSSLVPFGLVGNKTLLARPNAARRWFEALEPAGAFFDTRVDYFAGHLVRVLLDSPHKENAWRPEDAHWWRDAQPANGI